MSDSRKIDLAPAAIFDGRVCEVCGRRGGGVENAGLDNVNVAMGHQLCGHCYFEFNGWANGEQMLGRWLEKKAREAA